jgi:hypothetical protein
MGGHGPAAVVDLRQVLVVRPAEKGDSVRGVVAAQGEGVTMVELEPVAGRAAAALLIHESAAASVPLVHGPADGGRDVARGGARFALGEAFAGRLRAGEAAASSRSSFSVTAASTMAARSPSGTEERMRRRSLSSLSRSSVLAVNWTL